MLNNKLELNIVYSHSTRTDPCWTAESSGSHTVSLVVNNSTGLQPNGKRKLRMASILPATYFPNTPSP